MSNKATSSYESCKCKVFKIKIFFITIELACPNKKQTQMFIFSVIDQRQLQLRYFAIEFQEIIELGLERHWDYLTGLALTLWYIGFGLEKYLDHLIELEIILYGRIGQEICIKGKNIVSLLLSFQ